MAVSTKESSKTMKLKAKAPTNGPTEESIQVSGSKTKCTVKDFINGLTEEFSEVLT